MNTQKTNWKYLLIVIISGFIVAGGILSYQYWWLSRQEVELPEIKPPMKKSIEIPLDKLKEGKNEIEKIVIEKIEPKFLCDGVSGQNVTTKVIDYSYIGGEKVPLVELSCNIEDKAEVKMIAELATPGGEELHIDRLSIFNKKGNIIDERERFVVEDINEPLYDSTYLELIVFNFNDRVYFLIQGNTVVEHQFKNIFLLYVIDREENIKFIISGIGNIDYGIRIKNNFLLKMGNEIWEIGEDNVKKNKFPANKIIIKDSEISFE